MIAPYVVEEIRRLLQQGNVSQRKIARITGVSRGTVAAIASGKRPDYGDRRPCRQDETAEFLGPLERCPGCGGMVHMPCRLCRTRALKQRAQNRPMPVPVLQLEEPLGLELRGKDRGRYQQVRAEMLERQAAILRPSYEEPEEADVAFPEQWDELATDCFDGDEVWDETLLDRQAVADDEPICLELA